MQITIAVALFAVTLVGSLLIVSYVLIKLPPNYFHSSHERLFMPDKHRAVRWLMLGLKNLLGVLLIIFGILMSLPGVPGQGLLTILLGLMLMDFPGKRQVESRIVGQPKIQASINRLRRRFGKPPLLVD